MISDRNAAGGVASHAATNEELQELESQVQAQLGGQVRGLRLEWTPAGLVLYGRSRTYYGKQLAQSVLQDATLRRMFANEIDVL